MAETIIRTYFRIRFPAKAGTYGEWYSSNSGTDQWSELSKVRAILTRGQPKGYKGHIRVPFDGHEVVKFTEVVQVSSEVVSLPA